MTPNQIDRLYELECKANNEEIWSIDEWSEYFTLKRMRYEEERITRKKLEMERTNTRKALIKKLGLTEEEFAVLVNEIKGNHK